VSRLTEEEAHGLLVRVIDQQPGLVFNLLELHPAAPGGYHPAPGSPAPSWCVCSSCREMPTLEERLCCGHSPATCVSRLPVRL